MAILSSFLDRESENEMTAVIRYLNAGMSDFGFNTPVKPTDVQLSPLSHKDFDDFADMGWRWEVVNTDWWGVMILLEDYGGYLFAADTDNEDAATLAEYAASMLMGLE